MTFEEYVSVIRSGGNTPIAKIDFLFLEDENIKNTVTGEIVSGSITVNRSNGVRRSVSIQLRNIDGELNPSEDGDIWANYKFSVSLGLRYLNSDNEWEEEYWNQGVFVTRSPQVTSSNMGCELSIEGIDKFSLFDGQLGGSLDAIYQIAAGTDVIEAVKGVLDVKLDPAATLPRDPKTPIIPALEASISTTPYTIIEELSSNLGNVLEHMSNTTARNMYYDNTGRFRFEENIPDIEKGSIWDFKDTESEYLGSTRTYKFEELINKVIVVGANVNGDIATGSATNDNLQSSTCVQKIGVKIKSYSISTISTDEEAQAYAEYMLGLLSTLQNSVSINCVPLYHIDVDEIVTFTEANHGFNNKRFVVLGYTIPFGEGEMTLDLLDTDEIITL